MRRSYPYNVIAALCAAATGFAAMASTGPTQASPPKRSVEIRKDGPAPLLDYDMTKLLTDRDVLARSNRRFAAQTRSDIASEDCLSKAIYYEARSQSEDGQRAVAQVVINRVGQPGFAPSVCGVVYQGAHDERGCQFKFACDGSLFAPLELRAWALARSVALSALHGITFAPVGKATFYHSIAVHPVWSARFVLIAQIGSHVFYRRARA